ncbi:uncharacterized protein TNCV_3641121 [Trichonephila clavipes]|nr:uncharacterized protein TNCV_3641121 [Trichonephila clavipes]
MNKIRKTHQTLNEIFEKVSVLLNNPIVSLEEFVPVDKGLATKTPRREVQVLTHSSRIYDEAHFWLNGYVNKQNCRVWSEANPQVYVETPLHPETLTVWCALWGGGIIGPY